MIYGVPTQQEVGNPLGDPLQVSYLPYNPTQSQSMGNQTGYWSPQGQGKMPHLILLLSLFALLSVITFVSMKYGVGISVAQVRILCRLDRLFPSCLLTLIPSLLPSFFYQLMLKVNQCT